MYSNTCYYTICQLKLLHECPLCIVGEYCHLVDCMILSIMKCPKTMHVIAHENIIVNHHCMMLFAVSIIEINILNCFKFKRNYIIRAFSDVTAIV